MITIIAANDAEARQRLKRETGAAKERHVGTFKTQFNCTKSCADAAVLKIMHKAVRVRLQCATASNVY